MRAAYNYEFLAVFVAFILLYIVLGAGRTIRELCGGKSGVLVLSDPSQAAKHHFPHFSRNAFQTDGRKKKISDF